VKRQKNIGMENPSRNHGQRNQKFLRPLHLIFETKLPRRLDGRLIGAFTRLPYHAPSVHLIIMRSENLVDTQSHKTRA